MEKEPNQDLSHHLSILEKDEPLTQEEMMDAVETIEDPREMQEYFKALQARTERFLQKYSEHIPQWLVSDRADNMTRQELGKYVSLTDNFDQRHRWTSSIPGLYITPHPSSPLRRPF